VGDAAEPLLIGRDEFNLWVFRNTHGALGIDANSLIIKPSGIYGVDSDFAIKTTTADSGTPNFVVKASGNVGIGTNAPKNKLDVEGGMVIGATYSGTNTAPSNGLLVEGNVGIGTTSPGVKLEVNGGKLYWCSNFRNSFWTLIFNRNRWKFWINARNKFKWGYLVTITKNRWAFNGL